MTKSPASYGRRSPRGSSRPEPSCRTRESSHRSWWPTHGQSPRPMAISSGRACWRRVVTAGAAVVCRLRLQDAAKERLQQAVAQAVSAGLVDAEIIKTFEQALAAAHAVPLTELELRNAIKKPTHERRHRDSSAIEDLSRQ